jgi:hypothetical protein
MLRLSTDHGNAAFGWTFNYYPSVSSPGGVWLGRDFCAFGSMSAPAILRTAGKDAGERHTTSN